MKNEQGPDYPIPTCPRRYPELGDDGLDHDWETRTTWDGDPDVPGGTRVWHYRVCRLCGEEEQ